MPDQVTMFLAGPRGKLYLHPAYAPDLLALLGVYMGRAESGLRRAKASYRRSGDPMHDAQIAYWQDVQKALRWVGQTLHYGVEARDYQTAAAAVQPTVEAFATRSPLARKLTKAAVKSGTR